MTDTQNEVLNIEQQELEMQDVMPAKEQEMSVIPLRGIMIFPHTENHLDLGRPFSVRAAQESARDNTEVLLAIQKNADAGTLEADNLYEIDVYKRQCYRRYEISRWSVSQ